MLPWTWSDRLWEPLPGAGTDLGPPEEQCSLQPSHRGPPPFLLTFMVVFRCFYFVCVNALLAWMDVHHAHVWGPQRPEEGSEPLELK